MAAQANALGAIVVMPDFFEGDSVVKSVPEGSNPAVRFAWIKSMTSWDRVRYELCALRVTD